jgi:serine/threonine protein kinase
VSAQLPSAGSETDNRLLPGTRVREYEIVRPIASGGFGDVYEAFHPVLARRVALKILQERHADDAELERQFLAEGRILAQIRSPHVVAVYDADTHEGRAWIAMELLEGRTLRELLVDGKPLPLPRALDIAARIAEGAAALHGRNIVHRDLKPENVFVTDDGRVVVMDLGIAKIITASGESSASHVIGTARYMSPEQIQRVTTGVDVDARSDIYALSVMLYEMLSGRHPFDEPGTTLDALLLRQVNLPPPSLAERAPWVPASVRALVEKGLEKKRGRRQPSMNVFAREIAAAGSQVSSVAPSEPTERATRRSMALMALAVVLATAGVAFALWKPNSGSPMPMATASRGAPESAPAEIDVPKDVVGPMALPSPLMTADRPERPVARPRSVVMGEHDTGKNPETAPSAAPTGLPLLLPNESRSGATPRPLPPASSAGNRPVVL